MGPSQVGTTTREIEEIILGIDQQKQPPAYTPTHLRKALKNVQHSTHSLQVNELQQCDFGNETSTWKGF